MEWISPEDQAATHHSLQSQRQEHTGMWFINEISNLKWLGVVSSHPILWCRGIRTSRPTPQDAMLTSFLISRCKKDCFNVGCPSEVLFLADHCRSLFVDKASVIDPECVVSYYYLNYKHQNSQTPENILLSLLSQLLKDIPELWP